MVPTASWFLFALAGISVLALSFFVVCIRIVQRRRFSEPASFPGVSILKPMAGLDDELELNLESHLAIDYPAPFEILLGVRSEQDAAFSLAQAFARRHPERVRVVLQEGEPGHNPKVNQLLTLTRAARYEVIWCTDSNVRVAPHTLREAMAVLSQPKVGLVSNMFIGSGEKRLGAILDNLALAYFCIGGIVGAQVLGARQLVGKSVAIRKDVLKEIGGWALVQDVLAEDQRLGRALQKAGYVTEICPTPVVNVQIHQRLRQFWLRHSRWQMIRYRVVPPAAMLEPLLNPLPIALVATALAWRSPLAWLLLGLTLLATLGLAQAAAKVARGRGFKLHHLLLMPLRDLLYFAIWVHGATLRTVDWRGNRLLVLRKTRLAQEEALVRIRNMRLHR